VSIWNRSDFIIAAASLFIFARKCYSFADLRSDLLMVPVLQRCAVLCQE
jgi:hypothetical protein